MSLTFDNVIIQRSYVTIARGLRRPPIKSICGLRSLRCRGRWHVSKFQFGAFSQKKLVKEGWDRIKGWKLRRSFSSSLLWSICIAHSPGTVLSTNVRTSQVSSAVQPQFLAVEHCVVVCHTPLDSLDMLSFRPQSSPVAQCTSSKWFKSGYKIISHLCFHEECFDQINISRFTPFPFPVFECTS